MKYNVEPGTSSMELIRTLNFEPGTWNYHPRFNSTIVSSGGMPILPG